MDTPKPGIFPGMSMADYRAADAISNSDLKNYRRSPAHYKHPTHEETGPMRLGTAVHALLLEPATVLVGPTDSRRGKAWTEFEKAHGGNGHILVSKAENATAKAIADAVKGSAYYKQMLVGGQAETSYFWKDEKTGLMLKCRPDYVSTRNVLIDLKTTVDASARAFSDDAWRREYHVQGSFYMNGVASTPGAVTPVGFGIIAAETKDPRPERVALRPIPDAALEQGRFVWRETLDALAESKRTDSFPGYTSEPLRIPAWAKLEGKS